MGLILSVAAEAAEAAEAAKKKEAKKEEYRKALQVTSRIIRNARKKHAEEILRKIVLATATFAASLCKDSHEHGPECATFCLDCNRPVKGGKAQTLDQNVWTHESFARLILEWLSSAGDSPDVSQLSDAMLDTITEPAEALRRLLSADTDPDNDISSALDALFGTEGESKEDVLEEKFEDRMLFPHPLVRPHRPRVFDEEQEIYRTQQEPCPTCGVPRKDKLEFRSFATPETCGRPYSYIIARARFFDKSKRMLAAKQRP